MHKTKNRLFEEARSIKLIQEPLNDEWSACISLISYVSISHTIIISYLLKFAAVIPNFLRIDMMNLPIVFRVTSLAIRWGNRMIATMPVEQPWRIWVNQPVPNTTKYNKPRTLIIIPGRYCISELRTSGYVCPSADKRTTTEKRSTANPGIYFVGHIVGAIR